MPNFEVKYLILNHFLEKHVLKKKYQFVPQKYYFYYWQSTYKSCLKKYFLKCGQKWLLRVANFTFQNISNNPLKHIIFSQKSFEFCTA